MKRLASVLIFAVCGTALAGCSGGAGTPPAPPQMVFVDLETNQPVLQDVTHEAPAVNQKTGKRTLMPALYCSHCKTWRPAPPVEVAQRTPAALKCAQCKSTLVADGPPPE